MATALTAVCAPCPPSPALGSFRERLANFGIAPRARGGARGRGPCPPGHLASERCAAVVAVTVVGWADGRLRRRGFRFRAFHLRCIRRKAAGSAVFAERTCGAAVRNKGAPRVRGDVARPRSGSVRAGGSQRGTRATTSGGGGLWSGGGSVPFHGGAWHLHRECSRFRRRHGNAVKFRCLIR